MAKKRPTYDDPTLETPTTPGTDAPRPRPQPQPLPVAGDAESGEHRGKPPVRQTTAPTCPECGTRCVAGSSLAGVTYYHCPVEGCDFSTKQARPSTGLPVPKCPYHKTSCVFSRKASNAFFVFFRCAEPGCKYLEKRPRPNMQTRRHAADHVDESAR